MPIQPVEDGWNVVSQVSSGSSSWEHVCDETGIAEAQAACPKAAPLPKPTPPALKVTRDTKETNTENPQKSASMSTAGQPHAPYKPHPPYVPHPDDIKYGCPPPSPPFAYRPYRTPSDSDDDVPPPPLHPPPHHLNPQTAKHSPKQPPQKQTAPLGSRQIHDHQQTVSGWRTPTTPLHHPALEMHNQSSPEIPSPAQNSNKMPAAW